MSRKTIEAENDFRIAARKFRGNNAVDPLSLDRDHKSIMQNQVNIADDHAIVCEGLQKIAAALRDIYDVCARIEARQKGGTSATGSAGSSTRLPSTP